MKKDLEDNNFEDAVQDGPSFKFKRIKQKKSEMRVLNPRYIRQRAKYGFCEYDAVFIQRWFCKTVPDMLEYMADNLLTIPSRLEYEYWEKHKDELGIPSYFEIMTGRIDDELQKKISDEVTRDWQEILRRMAHLFRESFDGELPGEDRENEDYDYDKEWDYREACLKEALELFSKWFRDLWSW